MENFVKYALEHGGEIAPLIIPSELTQGTGLMNPSILNHNGKILINVRHTNYTFYHSEKKLFQHPYGPLTYLHPENDMHLRTWNWYGELDNNLNVTRYSKIDTSANPDQEMWDFVGLEDARLVSWDDRLFTTGVRRDTTTNGQGRMELCEIVVEDETVREISRHRIPPPNDPNSYCEKNWMPILSMPFHYVKWSNPTEVVKIDISGKKTTCETVKITGATNLPRDPRGGSQVLEIDGGYIALTHEVDLFNSEVGRKDAVYRHRFLIWDKNWNLIRYSKDFAMMDGQVEFSVGMVIDKNTVLITFGFQDNAAYVLRVPYNAMMEFINE